MYPTEKDKVRVSFGYWQRYPDNEFFRERGLAKKPHYGIDLAPKEEFRGTDIAILASVGGIIKDAYKSRGYGRMVKIESTESDAPNEHRFAHLKKYYVTKGERVVKGQIIGIMGSSGYSTATHLHYEVRKLKNGRWVPIDPKPYLT